MEPVDATQSTAQEQQPIYSAHNDTTGSIAAARLAGTRAAHVERAVRRRAFDATAGSLRDDWERRLVSQNFPSWNQLNGWLRQMEGLRRAA